MVIEGPALAGTIDAPEAATRSWDAVIVGAGPSGAIVARETARAGLATLLVERLRFPRSKVCGGCLNHTAVESLRRADLGERLDLSGGQTVGQVRLHHLGRTSTIAMPGGMALLEHSHDEMTWRIGDHGFQMTLSSRVRYSERISSSPPLPDSREIQMSKQTRRQIRRCAPCRPPRPCPLSWQSSPCR